MFVSKEDFLLVVGIVQIQTVPGLARVKQVIHSAVTADHRTTRIGLVLQALRVVSGAIRATLSVPIRGSRASPTACVNGGWREN